MPAEFESTGSQNSLQISNEPWSKLAVITGHIGFLVTCATVLYTGVLTMAQMLPTALAPHCWEYIVSFSKSFTHWYPPTMSVLGGPGQL